MKKSAKEEDGSYYYELSKKEISDLVMKKYKGIIRKSEKAYVESDEPGVAIMVSPKPKTKIGKKKEIIEELKAKIFILKLDMKKDEKVMFGYDEQIKELKDYITEVRPKADAYDRICKTLGIKSDVLGFIEKLKKDGGK